MRSVTQTPRAENGKQAPTAEQPATESAEQIGDRVKREEAERTNSIVAVCDLANRPQLAAGFIADGSKSVSDVLTALVRMKARPKG